MKLFSYLNIMSVVIIDERAPTQIERGLLKCGFYVLRAPKSKYLPTALASHPDMLTFLDGDTLISSAAYVEEAPAFFDDLSRLTRLSFTLTSSVPKKEYPHDCIFNALVVGNRLFARTASADGAIISLAKKRGYEVIDVKQGYPACTVLPLSSDAAVTADCGMARAMRKCGIEVTEIENGDILLPPYDYGFIGGAAGVFEGCVYFFGEPKLHRGGEAILSAARALGLRTVSLYDGPLLDLGRALFAK